MVTIKVFDTDNESVVIMTATEDQFSALRKISSTFRMSQILALTPEMTKADDILFNGRKDDVEVLINGVVIANLEAIDSYRFRSELGEVDISDLMVFPNLKKRIECESCHGQGSVEHWVDPWNPVILTCDCEDLLFNTK